MLAFQELWCGLLDGIVPRGSNRNVVLQFQRLRHVGVRCTDSMNLCLAAFLLWLVRSEEASFWLFACTAFRGSNRSLLLHLQPVVA